MTTLDRIVQKLFEDKVDWKSIDTKAALRQPACLELIRGACLVESFLPLYTSKMNELFWDNVPATSMFTLEAFEAFGHYYILRRYLEVVGYRPIEDREIVEARASGESRLYTDQVQELVNFMGTELFAAEFFRDVAVLVEEPVLKALLPGFVAEEVCHSQCASDLLAAMVQENPRLKERIVQAALRFQHVGTYAVPQVNPAKSDNLRVIQMFNERIGELTGMRPSDARAETMNHL